MFSDPKYNFSVCQKFFYLIQFKINIFHQIQPNYILSNAVTSGGILRHQHRRGERGAGPHRAVRQRGAQDLREHRAAGRQTGGAGVDTTCGKQKIFFST